MARSNLQNRNYRAMLRNKMHIRLQGDDFSSRISDFLLQHPEVAEDILNTDRFIIILTLLNHRNRVELTYDNLVFLINRIEMNNLELSALESDETRAILNDFFES